MGPDGHGEGRGWDGWGLFWLEREATSLPGSATALSCLQALPGNALALQEASSNRPGLGAVGAFRAQARLAKTAVPCLPCNAPPCAHGGGGAWGLAELPPPLLRSALGGWGTEGSAPASCALYRELLQAGHRFKARRCLATNARLNSEALDSRAPCSPSPHLCLRFSKVSMICWPGPPGAASRPGGLGRLALSARGCHYQYGRRLSGKS